MATAFNVWTPQGTITLTGSIPEQPNVIFEGNAQILSGNVFKMWYQTGGAAPGGSPSGMWYAESTDGINFTEFGSNPVIVDAWGIKVFKNGSTYYCYYTLGISSSTKILVATSTNGTTWTPQTPSSSITSANSPWSTAFDGAVFQLGVAGQDTGGLWHGYYGGAIGSGATINYPVGHATSPDLINWTPVAGNPVASFSPYVGIGSANLTFQKIGGVYYGWSQSVLPNEANAQQSANPGNLPTDIFRWSSSSPAGPWTFLGPGSTLYRSLTSEGVNSGNGQVGDPSIVFDGTNTWMYYTGSTNGTTGTNYTLNAAKAASTTFAQLVATYEGVFNVPISGNPSLNLNVLASDNFQRANVSPIGGNWSPEVAGKTAKIVSDVVTNVTVSTQGDSYWNALTWNADQWSQVTVSSFTASGFIGPSVRMSTSGADTSYKFVGATSGSGVGTLGNWLLAKRVAGTQTTLFTAPLTVSAGDVLLLVVIGTNLYVYYNGTMVCTVSDSSISSGAPGFNVDATSASPSLQANASISAWSGGTFQNAPPINPTGTGTGSLMMMGCGQ